MHETLRAQYHRLNNDRSEKSFHIAPEDVHSFAEVSFLSLPLQAGEANHFKILKMKLFILSLFIASGGRP